MYRCLPQYTRADNGVRSAYCNKHENLFDGSIVSIQRTNKHGYDHCSVIIAAMQQEAQSLEQLAD